MDEKLYLVCDDCGEAFDSMEIAFKHFHGEIDARWIILPESEAM